LDLRELTRGCCLWSPDRSFTPSLPPFPFSSARSRAGRLAQLLPPAQISSNRPSRSCSLLLSLFLFSIAAQKLARAVLLRRPAPPLPTSLPLQRQASPTRRSFPYLQPTAFPWSHRAPPPPWPPSPFPLPTLPLLPPSTVNAPAPPPRPLTS
jgi:hypothetical protein